MKLRASDATGALAAYGESLAIRDHLAKDKSDPEAQRDLSLSFSKIGDALTAQGKLAEALGYYHEGLNITNALVALDPANAQWHRDLWTSSGAIAYRSVLTRDFGKALESADQAIALAPSETWLYTNKAHALMFLGRANEARTIYLTHRGEKTEGDKLWEQTIRDDSAEMQKARLKHPLMDEIEKTFNKPK